MPTVKSTWCILLKWFLQTHHYVCIKNHQPTTVYPKNKQTNKKAQNLYRHHTQTHLPFHFTVSRRSMYSSFALRSISAWINQKIQCVFVKPEGWVSHTVFYKIIHIGLHFTSPMDSVILTHFVMSFLYSLTFFRFTSYHLFSAYHFVLRCKF